MAFVSKKSEQITRILGLIHPPQGVPQPPESGTLLERGLMLVLQKQMPAQRAVAAVETLRKEYVDWNEARVAQSQELAAHLAPRSASRSPERLAKLIPAARDIRAYLQEVFQRTHGLDLEFIRTDPAAGAKVLAQIPMLGNYLGSVLLWIAENGEQPVTLGHIRVLDRLRLITRTSSIKKAREAVAPLVPKPEDALRFSVAFGYIADAWCDSRKPICWECQLREECPTGKKVFKDWKVQQEKLAGQREREETRRVAQEARDHARALREHAREQKKAQAEAARREREAARERKRLETERKKSVASAAAQESASARTPAKKSGSKTGARGKATPPAQAKKKPAKASPPAAKPKSGGERPSKSAKRAGAGKKSSRPGAS